MALHTSWRRLSGPNAQRASAFGRHGDAKGPRSSDAPPRRERVVVAPAPRGREEGRRFAPQKTQGRGGPAQQWSGSQRDATQKEQDRNSPAELLPADPGTRWRLFQVAVPMRLDPGKDALDVHEALREAVARRLGCRLTLPHTAIRLVRKSFDSRHDKKWVYVVDVDSVAAVEAGARRGEAPLQGSLELVAAHDQPFQPLMAAVPAKPPASWPADYPPPAAVSGSVLDTSRSSTTTTSLPDSSSSTSTTTSLPDSSSGGGSTSTDTSSMPGSSSSRSGSSSSSSRSGSSSSSSSSSRSMKTVEGAAASHSSEGGAELVRLGGGPGSRLVQPVARAAHPVVVVGCGPAGLFAALTAAQAGLPVVLLDRGQAVEQRGKDIGALLVRGKLNPDSNLCYGEGGAGTWSDGKLTTKIGRNSDPVRRVLQALHGFGAPESILVAGKPHLGTERLVRILRAFRAHLVQALGVSVRFGCTVDDLMVEHGRVKGVRLKGGEEVRGSSVVLAVGHSARPMYRTLVAREVQLSPKPFALGFRIEHPQSWLDEVRYGERDAALVERGKGPIPVADYKLAVEVPDRHHPNHSNHHQPTSNRYNHHAPRDGSQRARGNSSNRAAGSGGEGSAQSEGPGSRNGRSSGSGTSRDTHGSSGRSSSSSNGGGSSSSSSSSRREQDTEGRAGEQQGAGAGGAEELGGGRGVPDGMRGVYSFCMCPGGQIVCTSTSEEELCINGMSFSRRNSQWANSALVVTVAPQDWAPFQQQHGSLAGLALQEAMEQEGARRGGGRFQAPVQRVEDFMGQQLSTGGLPSSSYRLGVKSAALHDLYPPALSDALQAALRRFDRNLRGFASCPEGLLHGVETRTSSPVKVDRLPGEDMQSCSVKGLYPCGEGAGYAGGIVSAAVDGLKVGEAVVRELLGKEVQVPAGGAGQAERQELLVL